MQNLSTDKKTDLKTILNIVRDVKDIARGSVDIVAQKMQLERMLLGDPQTMADLTEEISPADAIMEIRASERLLDRVIKEDPNSALMQELAKEGVTLKMLAGGRKG